MHLVLTDSIFWIHLLCALQCHNPLCHSTQCYCTDIPLLQNVILRIAIWNNINLLRVILLKVISPFLFPSKMLLCQVSLSEMSSNKVTFCTVLYLLNVILLSDNLLNVVASLDRCILRMFLNFVLDYSFWPPRNFGA